MTAPGAATAWDRSSAQMDSRSFTFIHGYFFLQ